MIRKYKVKASRGLLRRGRKLLDSVDIQLSVEVNLPRGVRITHRVIEEAIKYRAAHGKNPKGFKVRLIRWRNPDRYEGDKNKIHKTPVTEPVAGWREYGSQFERFDTLGRALRGRYMEYTVTIHRTSRRKKRRKKRARRPRRG